MDETHIGVKREWTYFPRAADEERRPWIFG